MPRVLKEGLARSAASCSRNCRKTFFRDGIAAVVAASIRSFDDLLDSSFQLREHLFDLEEEISERSVASLEDPLDRLLSRSDFVQHCTLRALKMNRKIR